MKISLLLTALILLAGGLLGWRQSRLITELQHDHQELILAAEQAGISVEEARRGQARGPKAALRAEEDRQAEAQAMVARWVELGKLMTGPEADHADAEQKAMALLSELGGFGADQFQILLQGVGEHPDLTEEIRDGLRSLLGMTMAQRYPRELLAGIAEGSSPEAFGPMSEYVISTALGCWAKDDPLAAVKWLQENPGKDSEVAGNLAKDAIILAAGEKNPTLALQLMKELEADAEMGTELAGLALTEEQRTALLTAVREQSDEALRDATLAGLAPRVAGAGFEKAKAWLEAAQLSPQEREALSMGLESSASGNDTGRWIEWLGEGEKLSESGTEQVRELMEDWTETDYRAAGEWLAATPDTPAKQASVLGYISAVAAYDSPAAAQWLDTLPRGEDREIMALELHREWKAQDPDAAQKFAESEGIAEE